MVGQLKRSETQSASQKPYAQTGEKRVSKENSIKNLFEKTLGQFLPEKDRKSISEEELFAVVISERLSSNLDKSAAELFSKNLRRSQQTQRQTSKDGSFSHEKAAIKALKATVESINMTAEQANDIYSQAFAASNFDKIKDSLYDRFSSLEDPSAAVIATNSAIKKAATAIEKIDSGSLAYEIRSLLKAKTTGKPIPSIANIGNPSSDNMG